MKLNIIPPAVLAAVSFAAASCSIYISPKGEVTERQVFFDDDIRTIEARNVTVTFDPRQPEGTLVIETNSDIQEYIHCFESDGTLVVLLDTDSKKYHNIEMDIRVPGRQFSRVEGEDGAFLKGSITSRYLDILLRDGTLMNCHGLNLKEAAARLEDGSNMELSGYCNRFSLECRDGSLARCRRLECGYVYADIRDGSSASVSAHHGVDGYCEDGSILDTDII